MIIATVIKIATKTLFKTHTYTFGGLFFRQRDGGPIGLRGTCAIARLAMQIWDTRWSQTLKDLGIETELWNFVKTGPGRMRVSHPLR